MEYKEITKNRSTFEKCKSAPDKTSNTYLFFKRAIDIICSFLGLIVLSPLFLILAFLIKLDDGGSVFYKHK